MPVKVRHANRKTPDGPENTDPEMDEGKFTHVDGQTFAWQTNQKRNFADDGVGAAHALYDGDENKTQEDNSTGHHRS